MRCPGIETNLVLRRLQACRREERRGGGEDSRDSAGRWGLFLVSCSPSECQLKQTHRLARRQLYIFLSLHQTLSNALIMRAHETMLRHTRTHASARTHIHTHITGLSKISACQCPYELKSSQVCFTPQITVVSDGSVLINHLVLQSNCINNRLSGEYER